MKKFYKIFRTFILIVLALTLLLPTLLYVGLELDFVQNPARKRAEKELSALLGAEVRIGQVSVAPFNRVTLRAVDITCHADTVARIRRLGAGIDLYKLLLSRRLEFGYAEIFGLDLRVCRDSVGAPLNIQPIIDALAPKDPSAPPKPFDLAIRTVVLRHSRLSYDVGNCRPAADSSRFDPDHIAVDNLRADIRIPRLSNDDITIDLKRLAFDEKSGFSLTSLSAKAVIAADMLSVFDPSLQLPHSRFDLSSVALPVKGEGSFAERLRSRNFNIALLPGSYVTLSDFAAFVPALRQLDARIDIEADAEGTPDHILLNSLSVVTPGSNLLISKAHIANVADTAAVAEFSFPKVSLSVDASTIPDLLRLLERPVTDKLAALLSNAGHVSLTGSGTFRPGSLAQFAGFMTTGCGNIDISARAHLPGAPEIEATLTSTDFHPSMLLSGILPPDAVPSLLGFTADTRLSLPGGLPIGELKLQIPSLTYRNNRIDNLSLDASMSPQHQLTALLDVDDDLLASARLNASVDVDARSAAVDLSVANLDLRLFSPGYQGRALSLHSARGEASGRSIDDARVDFALSDLRFSDGEQALFRLDDLALTQHCDSAGRTIRIGSEILDADIAGRFSFASLISNCRDMVSVLLPALVSAGSSSKNVAVASPDNIDAHIRIKSTESLSPLLKLPVTVIFPADIYAKIDVAAGNASLTLDAPFLQQGNKLIEKTGLTASVAVGDSGVPQGALSFTTLFPAKKQKIMLNMNSAVADDLLSAGITWEVPGNKSYYGDLALDSRFSRDSSHALFSDINISDGKAVFNDTVWTFRPAQISVKPGAVAVGGFGIDGFNQSLQVDGIATASPDDSLHMVLRNIDLDYVFETLGISNAMFGGRANGNFYGSALLSPSPRLFTDDLDVEGIKYNHCRMGDAKIRSGWDVDRKAVTITADITGDHNNVSRIDGFIKPMTEELDFRFRADDVPVGFLLPFMSAFTSAVDGHASGDAHLYGTFKYVDMTGNLFANNFRMKVDFTNCWYTTTDSIRMRPGFINIPGVVLHDDFGNKARMDGWVKHTFFKAPEFEFNVSDARNLLVYDIRKSPDLRWYGTVFGNGGANISGKPGVVKIGINMSTAPKSNFTFVLSDAQQAYDYNFITFRDKNALNITAAPDTTMSETLRRLQARVNAASSPNLPSDYFMDINVAVNDNTRMTLIMDPAGGDYISALGNGNLRLTYGSSDERLNMYGDYTLSEGSYKFTLQDIIIKDFKIKPGSVIAFNGDPYAASLDVKAAYSLTANLSELDESFSQDRELARPNVPLNALLNVSGDIRQPEVDFDLEFPTLTSDTYRKVRSIISTDDMMNRQIIYLLALNRFYTPDYMADASRGNEFVSVASSAISSQLSNILGQLSDKWSIAPNFRSDRGDFSDMEFDVALSSRLLNNRLLLNGNLGYRDKALNNNSFIGDFDLEYLLNRSGSLRLKAYNRYNDRNFYVKSALTTQGVGLIYRRDFDNMFRFLRRPQKLKETNKTDK